MSSAAGKYIMILGIVIVAAGILIYFFHDKLHWIGRLPGDIRMEKENFRFYFPVVTMIVFSVLLSVVAGLLKRFL